MGWVAADLMRPTRRQDGSSAESQQRTMSCSRSASTRTAIAPSATESPRRSPSGSEGGLRDGSGHEEAPSLAAGGEG